MLNLARLFWMMATALVIAGLTIVIASTLAPAPESATASAPPVKVNTNRDYLVLSWNDLGMHCYNRDFNDLAVLPPANTLWAQVIKVGNPPQVITTGVTVEYSFPSNTYSIGKSNFWSPNTRPGPNNGVQNARAIFGLSSNLPDNIGLAGNGLAGQMTRKSDHFMAEWIPITEYNDSDWNTRDPYQLATVIVRDSTTNAELARETVVTPVSTEMRCDRCHSNNGDGNEGIATGVVEQNILTKHDQDNSGDYPNGHALLMNSRPVLCAECHSANAIGEPGKPGLPSLSKAMHTQHADEVTQDTAGCYNCHPGPATKCLRDVMSAQGMNCVSCHGTMTKVSQNPNPWLNEPRCDTCHIKSLTPGGPNVYQQNQALYHLSSAHGGVYCEGCHDSTHAIAPSTQPRDALKFLDLQGHTGKLDLCTVCHSSWPTGAGPHGRVPPQILNFTFGPDGSSSPEPGATIVYTHTLKNTGNVSDTYSIEWNSSRGWAVADAPSPVALDPGQARWMTVTVSVPGGGAARGQIETTLISATSAVSGMLTQRVVDVTRIPVARVYLPLIMK